MSLPVCGFRQSLAADAVSVSLRLAGDVLVEVPSDKADLMGAVAWLGSLSRSCAAGDLMALWDSLDTVPLDLPADVVARRVRAVLERVFGVVSSSASRVRPGLSCLGAERRCRSSRRTEPMLPRVVTRIAGRRILQTALTPGGGLVTWVDTGGSTDASVALHAAACTFVMAARSAVVRVRPDSGRECSRCCKEDLVRA